MYNKQVLIDTLPKVLTDPKAAEIFFKEAKKCLIILLPTSTKTAALFKKHFTTYGNIEDYEDLIQSCLAALWENIVNNKIEISEKIDGYISAIAKNQLLNLVYRNSKPTSASNTYEMAERYNPTVNIEEQIEISPEILAEVEKFHEENRGYHGYVREVSQFSTDFCYINTYESLQQAADKTGVAISSISRCVRHERKTAGGYIWLYSDDKICELMKYD